MRRACRTRSGRRSAKGITVIGLHAASLPGPAPDLHLFVNIQEDPREIGKAEADWAIADSNGKAKVVVVTHNEYQIAATKSGETRDTIKACSGCTVLDYVSFPAGEVAQRMPQLTTSWVQRFGAAALHHVGRRQCARFRDSRRCAAPGVSPDQVKLIGADGNRSAYERIRKGNQYQTVTVSEPIELQAYQAVDEFNRAFNKAPPSGFVQPPYLVTAANVDKAGGAKNLFVPENDYKGALPEALGRQSVTIGPEEAAAEPGPPRTDRNQQAVRRHAGARWRGSRRSDGARSTRCSARTAPASRP